jgi:hypothetical protein
MIEITLTTDGLFTWIKTLPRAVKAERVKTAIRKADRIAITEWMTRSESPGMKDRFERGRQKRLNPPKTHNAWYARWKSKAQAGSPITWVGPREHLHLKVRLTFLRQFRTQSRNGTDTVTTRLIMPGANVLNAIKGPDGDSYRRQFLNLTQNTLDQNWLLNRRNVIAKALIIEAMTRPRKKTVKP